MTKFWKCFSMFMILAMVIGVVPVIFPISPAQASGSPPAPVLISPTAGANAAGTSINFQWNTSIGATSYWLSVQRISDHVFIVNKNVGNVLASNEAVFLNDGNQYVWAVAANNSAGWTSSAYQLFTNGTPAAPVLTYPAAGGNASGTSVNFQWAASAGATSYWLSVQRVSDHFFIINKNVGTVLASNEGSFPNDGTQYVWAVAANNSAGWTSSAYQLFTNGKPAAPVLTYPVADANASGTSVNFQWAASAGATSYWLSVQRVSDHLFIINKNVGNVLASNESSFPNDGTQYVWAVAANNSAGWTASAYQTFFNGGPDNPTAPTLGEVSRFVILASQKITTTAGSGGASAVSNGDMGIIDQARSYQEGFPANEPPLGQVTGLTGGLLYGKDDDTDKPGIFIPSPYASVTAFINQTRTDLGNAYTFLSAATNATAPMQACPTALGGHTLTRGLYWSAVDIGLEAGTLTLDALGDPNSVWIITTNGKLTTGAGGNVVLAHGALAKNVYWRAAALTTIAADTTFYGNVFVYEQINVLDNAAITGRLCTTTEQVTLIGDAVTKAP